VATERPRKTAFGQFRNKRQNDLAAASKASVPLTGSNRALVYTKRWNRCNGTW